MKKKKVAPDADPPAPAHLSERSKALWCEVVPVRAKSAERQQLVLVALEALDLMEAARLAMAADGLTVTTKRSGCVHAHPLLDASIKARRQFLRAWRTLKFHWSAQDGFFG
jgi:phage terminase small subunit